MLGGGERSVHTLGAYAISAAAFPSWLHYVALGHLHRAQEMPAKCPTWYSGSPMQLDFGEENDTKQVLIVDATPGAPVKVDPVRIESGRRLTTITGTLKEVREVEVDPDAWIRVRLRERAKAGLADQVRELFPNAVDVTLVREDQPEDGPRVARIGREPQELFAEYLQHNDIDDRQLRELFSELHEEVMGAS